jgi:hypothetical protein
MTAFSTVGIDAARGSELPFLGKSAHLIPSKRIDYALLDLLGKGLRTLPDPNECVLVTMLSSILGKRLIFNASNNHERDYTEQDHIDNIAHVDLLSDA